VLAAVVSLAACYQRAVGGACHVSCTSSACPSDLACGTDGLCKIPGAVDCTAQAGGDGGSADADVKPPDGAPCPGGTVYGTGLLQVCLAGTLPSSPIGTITEVTDGPGTPIACTKIVPQTQGPEVCVIAMQQIDINGMVRVAGGRAIAFVGTDSVTVEVNGGIDASSATGASSGPGAPSNCTGAGGPGSSVLVNRGAGGGAGGSYGGPGGNGGSSDGIGGIAGAAQNLVAIVGGCAGGKGGDSGGSLGGAGGAGGGAVYLLAGGPIAVYGSINASGAGGTAPDPESGGAGGGAGGLIALDGLSYALDSATMFAIGGPGSTGGGGNASGVAASEARVAADAPCSPDPPPGGGPCGNGTGSSGMSGGPGYLDGASGLPGGGGGAGGGAGFIVAKGWSGPNPSGTATIIPPIGKLP
jgi:hypothetical protein